MDTIAYETNDIHNENQSLFFLNRKYFYRPWKYLIIEYIIFKKQKAIMIIIM